MHELQCERTKDLNDNEMFCEKIQTMNKRMTIKMLNFLNQIRLVSKNTKLWQSISVKNGSNMV